MKRWPGSAAPWNRRTFEHDRRRHDGILTHKILQNCQLGRPAAIRVHSPCVMNFQPPEQPGAPDRSTPEAWALRAEWRSQPPSEAHDSAERALAALSRAAGSEAGGSGPVDVPPVPDELRSRWADRYGKPPAEAEPRRSGRPENREREEGGFLEWFRGLGRPGRLAWVGGAGAVAAVLLVVSQFQDGGQAGGDGDGGSRVRGSGSGGPSGDAAPVAMVAPAAPARDAVLAVVKQAFPVRDVRVLATADEAAALARSEPRLVVVNLVSGLVTAWRGGQLHEEFPPQTPSSPAGVVIQIESADESLEKDGASP